MGNCSTTPVCQESAPSRQITILLLGLDSGGKTTVVANLNNDSTDSVTPTIGFSSTAVRVGRFEVSFFDIGGGSQIRGIWDRYYAQAHGVIFVVDATAVDRLWEVKESLQNVTKDSRVAGKPMLILANKQDQSGAVDEHALQSHLELGTLLGDRMNTVNVVKSIAISNRGQAKTSLRSAVVWLLEAIDGQYDQISERVKIDTENKRAQEAREKQERAERVRRIREERERQAAQGKEETDAAVQDDQSNPFRPVEEVIKTIEDRVKKSKATTNTITILGETNTGKVLDAAIEHCSSKVDEPGPSLENSTLDSRQCDPRVEQLSHSVEQRRPPVRVVAESEVEEVEYEGSLSNSDTLTNVTEHIDSQGSTPDIANETLQATPSSTANESTQAPVGSGKIARRHGAMFLSRLKRRNRTAPAPEPEVALRERPPPPSKLSWLTPSQPGALEQLPELPRQPQLLPPIRMTKAAPGMQEWPFLLAEDVTVPHSNVRFLPPLAS